MYRKYIKRLLDIIFSALSLGILSPVFLVTAILVRAKLGSPVIFRQRRPGKDEKIFTMYKFRTMTDRKDENGELLPDGERLTGFGKKLRSTSIDELPELLNILKGEMSFVGPRPLLKEYLPYYTKEEHHRHDMRPGLTGLAQINGRNDLEWKARFHIDIQYIKHVNFRLDSEVLFRTIAYTVRKKDIKSGNEMVMTDLDVERQDKIDC